METWTWTAGCDALLRDAFWLDHFVGRDSPRKRLVVKKTKHNLMFPRKRLDVKQLRRLRPAWKKLAVKHADDSERRGRDKEFFFDGASSATLPRAIRHAVPVSLGRSFPARPPRFSVSLVTIQVCSQAFARAGTFPYWLATEYYSKRG